MSAPVGFLHTVDLPEALEERVGRPVPTANQVGVRPGLGSLFRMG